MRGAQVLPGLAILVIASSALAAAREPSPTDSSRGTEGPRNAVWFQQPLMTTYFALTGAVFASVGANVELAKDRVAVFELTAVRVRDPALGGMKYWQTGVAFGFLQPLQRLPNVGLYLSPKLFGLLSAEEQWATRPGPGASVTPPGTSFELHGGGDLVLQLDLEPLFVAFMGGATIGYCINCVDGALTAFGGQAFPLQLGGGPRGNRPVFTLNLNMLRVGYTW